MKVNQNLSAVVANGHLHRSENKLTAAIERLSSGYKINKAKDNPSGMAISNKMRAQIMALNQSSQNAADGTSVMQTADGALNEVHSILQRMRELCVQAASDTLTVEDKEACQQEIDDLKAEVDRIAKDTEFNGKVLLDGSQDTRIFPSVGGELAGTYIRNFQTSDDVPPKDYNFYINKAPERATIPDVQIEPFTGDDIQRVITINGCSATIEPGDSEDVIFEKLKELGDLAGVKVEKSTANANEYTFTSFEYGSRQKVELSYKEQTMTVTGENNIETVVSEENVWDDKVDSGEDTGIMYDPDLEFPLGEGFSQTATYSSDGTRVEFRDQNGFLITFDFDPEAITDDVALAKLQAGIMDVRLDVTDLGSMTLQVGAHENQVVDVRIPSVTCEALYIDDIDVVRRYGGGDVYEMVEDEEGNPVRRLVSYTGADEALGALDDAIAQVSSVRSRIGAYQNRLDYAVKSLDGTVENMEAAISRIMDTDMAEEMSTYSNMNVLDQAGIAVLTQANDLPQQVLQLLQ